MKSSFEQVKREDNTIGAIIHLTLVVDYTKFIDEIGYLNSSDTQMFDQLVFGRWTLEERSLY